MVVDVVLCGECRFFQFGACFNKTIVGKNVCIPRSKDAFCSEGKRRDQDE